jgi:hypothetical protein
MECQLAPFPVKYLGVPLSTRRLTAVAFQPLVDRLADKLPTWKRAGRLTLIRAHGIRAAVLPRCPDLSIAMMSFLVCSQRKID